MSSLSSGLSEAQEVPLLSTASAVTLTTFILLICHSLDVQYWEVVSWAHMVISYLWLLRVLFTACNVADLRIADKKLFYVRASKILPFFPISWLKIIDVFSICVCVCVFVNPSTHFAKHS